jgi:hypothetical protein
MVNLHFVVRQTQFYNNTLIGVNLLLKLLSYLNWILNEYKQLKTYNHEKETFIIAIID